MILDKIENCSKYFSLGDGFEKGFQFLLETDMLNLAEGRYDIDGENVFVLLSSYDTKIPEEKKPEAHRKYADIQYIIKGSEKIGYAHLKDQKITKDYDFENDIIFYDEVSFYFKLPEGSSLYFFRMIYTCRE